MEVLLRNAAADVTITVRKTHEDRNQMDDMDYQEVIAF